MPATQMLSSYNARIGIEKMDMVNGSVVGVMTAAKIKITMMA